MGHFYKFCLGCAPVSTPSNGGVTYDRDISDGRYSYDTVLTYSCHNKYYKSAGFKTRICARTGQWTGSPSQCKRGNENRVTFTKLVLISHLIIYLPINSNLVQVFITLIKSHYISVCGIL